MISLAHLRKPRSWGLLLPALAFGGAIALTLQLVSERWGVLVAPDESRCLKDVAVILLDKADKSVERGDVIAFEAPEAARIILPTDEPVGKRALGLPGDEVIVSAAGVQINGVLVAEGLAAAVYAGVPEAQFFRKLRLGPGEFFMLGDSERSFDSRYWGPVRQEQIIGTGRVLW